MSFECTELDRNYDLSDCLWVRKCEPCEPGQVVWHIIALGA